MRIQVNDNDNDSDPQAIPDNNVIDEEGYYDEINKDVEIDTAGAEDGFFIRVDGVDRADITVSGGNILHMKVYNKFNMGGNDKIILNDDSRLIVYIKDGSDVTISGNAIFHDYMYAPDSKIEWNGGGTGGNIYGGVVGKEFKGASSANVKIIHDPDLLKEGAFIEESIEELEKKSTGLARGAWLD